MSLSGLELPGTFNMAVFSPPNVGQTMNFDISAALVNTDRLSVDGAKSVAYYILAEYNINGEISHTSSDSAEDLDDAYSMNAISVSSDAAIGTVLSLPTASNVTVLAGNIDALGLDGTSLLGTFPVILTVTVNQSGMMTSQIAINGSDAVVNESEDYTKAQVVYWPVVEAIPSVSATTADVLTSAISANVLDTHYTAEITAIKNLYDNQSMITSWTISFDPVTSSTSNTLSKHARFLNKANGDTPLFAPGEKLVCASPFTYGVSINNYLGNATTIVTDTYVYGVLQQT